jgi:hypothetical protein
MLLWLPHLGQGLQPCYCTAAEDATQALPAAACAATAINLKLYVLKTCQVFKSMTCRKLAPCNLRGCTRCCEGAFSSN